MFQSFEGGKETPIRGTEKYVTDVKSLPIVRALSEPGVQSKSTTHGGFDDDETTMASVLALIKGNSI